MLFIIITSMWNVRARFVLFDLLRVVERVHAFVLQFYPIIPHRCPQYLRYRNIILSSYTKISFGAGGQMLNTPEKTLNISRQSFSDRYNDIVILVAKTYFAITIAAYDTPLSYRLLKKFKTCSVVMSIVLPSNDPTVEYICYIQFWYFHIMMHLIFNILTVVSL